MRVGYVTTYDARDPRAWSGTGHRVAKALRQQRLEVSLIGPLREPLSARAIIGAFTNRVRRRNGHHRERSANVGRAYARQAARRLTDIRADIAFSPGTIPIAYLDFDGPIAFWSDATFHSLLDFYPEYSRLDRYTVRAGERMEVEAIRRSAAAIYSSEWAAESALERYDANPSRVHVVPFGANIETPGNAVVTEGIASRPLERCNLVFVSADWKRKRGHFAVEVARELNRLGLPTSLTVVGASPARGEPVPAFVRLEGVLDKRSPHDLARLADLYLDSHFLVLPSLADCTPIVVSEAFAFGVPVVATDVGGVSSLVSDDATGALMPAEATPADHAARIASLISSEHSYRSLAEAAREDHLKRLNWSVAGERVADLLRALDR